jgi:cytochrome c-type biogenesis protein CcmE
MTESSKRQIFGVIAIAVALAGLAGITWGNLGQNLVYYWSPTELVAKGEAAEGVTVRLGGMVVPGSFDLAACNPGCTFKVTDGKSEVVVKSEGMPPQMFREGQGCVVEGTADKAGVFHTDRIMVKHSNEYRPPKDGEMPGQGTLADGTNK